MTPWAIKWDWYVSQLSEDAMSNTKVHCGVCLRLVGRHYQYHFIAHSVIYVYYIYPSRVLYKFRQTKRGLIRSLIKTNLNMMNPMIFFLNIIVLYQLKSDSIRIFFPNHSTSLLFSSINTKCKCLTLLDWL